MTYKIISAIIRDNLRFDTPRHKKAMFRRYQKSGSLSSSEVSRTLMYFHSESKLLSISSFNWFLFIVPNFIVGLPFSGKVTGWVGADFKCTFHPVPGDRHLTFINI